MVLVVGRWSLRMHRPVRFSSVCGMTNVVEMTGVVKRFGTVTALDALDLAVAEGEVHGFLGPNGAGKTTTLRLLLGMLRANAGSIRVLGMDPWRAGPGPPRPSAGDVRPGPDQEGPHLLQGQPAEGGPHRCPCYRCRGVPVRRAHQRP